MSTEYPESNAGAVHPFGMRVKLHNRLSYGKSLQQRKKAMNKANRMFTDRITDLHASHFTQSIVCQYLCGNDADAHIAERRTFR